MFSVKGNGDGTLGLAGGLFLTPQVEPDWLDLGLFVAGGIMFMVILVWWR